MCVNGRGGKLVTIRFLCVTLLSPDPCEELPLPPTPGLLLRIVTRMGLCTLLWPAAVVLSLLGIPVE